MSVLLPWPCPGCCVGPTCVWQCCPAGDSGASWSPGCASGSLFSLSTSLCTPRREWLVLGLKYRSLLRAPLLLQETCSVGLSAEATFLAGLPPHTTRQQGERLAALVRTAGPAVLETSSGGSACLPPSSSSSRLVSIPHAHQLPGDHHTPPGLGRAPRGFPLPCPTSLRSEGCMSSSGAVMYIKGKSLGVVSGL